MIYISSAEVYGLVKPSKLPVKETHPSAPANLYAYSKAFSEELLFAQRKRNGLDVIISRPFTHIGPRQSPKFAASSFARRIALAEKGLARPVIKVGNLQAKRDMIDVRDMVKGYRLMAEIEDNPGPFNLSSGQAVTIDYVLDNLLSHTEMKIEVEQDPSKFRPVDIPVYEGDSTLFSKKTGWTRDFSLNDSLKALLNYWRNIV